MDAIATENFYFNILFWAPYYFSKIGYGFESSLISFIVPITMAIGSIIFEQLSKFCDSTMKFLIGGFYFIIFLINLSFMFMGAEKELIPVYMGLLGLVGFLLVPGFSRTATSDPSILSRQNARMTYLIIIMYKAIDQLILAVMFVVVGWLMEKSKNICT